MTPASTWRHSAFYRFHPVADPAAVVSRLRALGEDLPGLGGAVVVAAEGWSGAVAAPVDELARFEAAVQADALLAPLAAGLGFKHSDCAQPPYGRFKVQLKPEIVAFGQGELPLPDDDHTHLSPAAWRALLGRDDLVLIDNRNSFEYRLGHFEGAIDPQVDNFRDFAAFVQQHAPEWRAQNRPVAMYCTGGIRCEKTSAWMSRLGLEVYQLQGGILNYLAEQGQSGQAPGWVGDCFVFDQRIALDARLQPTGATPEQVYRPDAPDEAWRLARARRLADAVAPRD